MNTNEVIPLDLAVIEMAKFVAFHEDEDEKTSEEIQEKYPQAIKALVSGNLVFNDDYVPVYNLVNPILNDDKEVSYKEIKFRTRIYPLDLARITKGMQVSKEQMLYIVKCISYVSGMPEAIVNKLSKKDYKVVEQVSTVFM